MTPSFALFCLFSCELYKYLKSVSNVEYFNYPHPILTLELFLATAPHAVPSPSFQYSTRFITTAVYT